MEIERPNGHQVNDVFASRGDAVKECLVSISRYYKTNYNSYDIFLFRALRAFQYQMIDLPVLAHCGTFCRRECRLPPSHLERSDFSYPRLSIRECSPSPITCSIARSPPRTLAHRCSRILAVRP